jgi:phage/plasmid-associated DNA primase
LDKLKAESSGILKVLVEYCLEYQKRGLSDIPKAIQQGTDDYKAESDPLAQFIFDSCVESGNASVKTGELYKGYLTWADSQGFTLRERMSNTSFGRRLANKYDHKQTEKGRLYLGIGLKNDGSLGTNDGLRPVFNVLSNIEASCGSDLKKGSNPSYPSLNDTKRDSSDEVPEPGLPSDLVEVWVAVGRPIVYLGAGESTQDLEFFLTNNKLNERQISALQDWYQKNRAEVI